MIQAGGSYSPAGSLAVIPIRFQALISQHGYGQHGYGQRGRGALAASGVSHIGFEDPSLPQHREVVTRGGLAVRGVPVDQHGICVDQISSGSGAARILAGS